MAVLRPVFKLLKHYQLVIIGDREFRGSQLAYWLKRKKVQFVLRVQESSIVKINHASYFLERVVLPGKQIFFQAPANTYLEVYKYGEVDNYPSESISCRELSVDLNLFQNPTNFPDQNL